jgi:capsular exopolysaccharide synthesis family protein
LGLSKPIGVNAPAQNESRKLMSRVYDALRLAGQFPDSSQEVLSAEPKSVSDNEMVELSEILAKCVPNVPITEALPSQEVLPEVLEQTATSVPSRNGLLGCLVTVALNKRARILPHSVDPRLAEHYRIIRTNILQQQSKNPFKSLLVASPDPQDGKTLTLLNLALTFAMVPSFRVLVVDGDLRKGNLGATLGLGDSVGFSNFIEGRAKLDEVILKSETLPINFMLHGNAKLAPAELLQSPLLGKQIRKLTEHFDLVLIDSPPATMFADTKLLASVCDGVLLVTRAFSTTGKVLKQVYDDLQQFRIIGTVLNGVVEPGSYGRYHYNHSGTDR